MGPIRSRPSERYCSRTLRLFDINIKKKIKEKNRKTHNLIKGKVFILEGRTGNQQINSKNSLAGVVLLAVKLKLVTDMQSSVFHTLSQDVHGN